MDDSDDDESTANANAEPADPHLAVDKDAAVHLLAGVDEVIRLVPIPKVGSGEY